MRTATVLACLLACLGVGSAGAAVGELRVLVVPLTWGPALPSEQELRLAADDANAFFGRASFGRASLDVTIAPPVTGFVVPPRCFSGSNEDTGLGAVSLSARAAAAGLGYDLNAYDRFVYVFPERVCGLGGVGAGRDVMLAGGIGALVHELGHTFRLPHAGSSSCPACTIREYGDPESVMGHGSDFNAWEKAQLGWLGAARRVTATGAYVVAPVDRPSDGAQALLVRTRAGTLWVEHRLSPAPRVSIRIVKRPPGGGATRSIHLAGGRSVATVKGLLQARRVPGGLSLVRLDRR